MLDRDHYLLVTECDARIGVRLLHVKSNTTCSSDFSIAESHSSYKFAWKGASPVFGLVTTADVM